MCWHFVVFNTICVNDTMYSGDLLWYEVSNMKKLLMQVSYFDLKKNRKKFSGVQLDVL